MSKTNYLYIIDILFFVHNATTVVSILQYKTKMNFVVIVFFTLIGYIYAHNVEIKPCSITRLESGWVRLPFTVTGGNGSYNNG